MSNLGTHTGTYIFDKESGKVVKVSSRVPVIKKIPDWKRNMNPADEERRGFASLEAQGKLHDVDDRECWQDHLRR